METQTLSSPSDQPIPKSDLFQFKPADMPDDIIALLQDAGQRGDQAAWTVGQLTNQLLMDLDAEIAGSYSRMSVYASVAVFVGCAAETVRMRAHVAANVPAWIRAKYHELGFHQLKAIIPFASKPDDWENWCEAWLDHCVTSGLRITSVDGLRAWLHSKPDGPGPELVRYKRLLVLLQKVSTDDRVPQAVRWVCYDTLAGLRKEAPVGWEVTPL